MVGDHDRIKKQKQGFFFRGIEVNFGAEFGPESSKLRETKTMSLVNVNAKFSEIFGGKHLLNCPKSENL